MIGAIKVGSPQWMYMYEQEVQNNRQSRIEQAIVDIKGGPHTHDWIVQVLESYGFTEASLSNAECEYINKMINS